jgi:5-methyltetrahydrofolate--homocysteine methyltransferase
MQPLTLDAINRKEALRYMGFGDVTPAASILQRIDAWETKLRRQATPRFISRTEVLSQQPDGTLLAGALPLRGKDIVRHLEGCSHAVILAATLSAHTDRLIAQAQARDMMDALITEGLANAGIEQICDKAEQYIREAYPERYLTWRFSPGYGDFPLEIQGTLLRLLDAPRKIGLTATNTSILIPRKSVTAIIGLSDTPLPRPRRGCAACAMGDRCPYRNKGVHCSHVESASDA